MDERPDLGRAPAWARHLHECIHDMRAQQALILRALGEESEDGKSGTGLTGRVIRTEAKVLQHDRFKERVIGGFMTLTVALAVVWWLVKDRLAGVFGVSGS